MSCQREQLRGGDAGFGHRYSQGRFGGIWGEPCWVHDQEGFLPISSGVRTSDEDDPQKDRWLCL